MLFRGIYVSLTSKNMGGLSLRSLTWTTTDARLSRPPAATSRATTVKFTWVIVIIIMIIIIITNIHNHCHDHHDVWWSHLLQRLIVEPWLIANSDCEARLVNAQAGSHLLITINDHDFGDHHNDDLDLGDHDNDDHDHRDDYEGFSWFWWSWWF